jgi:hypothetical protein
MRFCVRLSGPIFRVKLNPHIYKTVKDFKTSSLTDIAAANVCTMKKTRGLYHVPERRYFNFGPGRFSEIVAILTAPAVEMWRHYVKHGEMETWKHGDMENGDMETWRHGDMDRRTWTRRHGHGGMDMET